MEDHSTLTWTAYHINLQMCRIDENLADPPVECCVNVLGF